MTLKSGLLIFAFKGEEIPVIQQKGGVLLVTRSTFLESLRRQRRERGWHPLLLGMAKQSYDSILLKEGPQVVKIRYFVTM